MLAITLPTIAEPGRAGPDWWSLQPLGKESPPFVRDLPVNANPIDAFIRSKLEAAGLRAANPADKVTLIRRLTFDLTGIPPTPGEIDSFVADDSAGVFEKLVDRLLASPAYGERWARHWLDVVRFSESHGFEYDRLRDHAWNYRDYVIRSLNNDKPYAQFVREQLAGDVLPGAGSDGVIATGMLVAGPYDQAGMGAASQLIRLKAREDELEDMIGLVSQTFLGVTLNCARCHDHKFDPFTARDYYRLKAVLAGVTPGDRPVLSNAEDRVRGETLGNMERQLREAKSLLLKLESAAREKVLAQRGQLSAKKDESLPRPISRWAFDSDGKDSIGTLHAELKNGARVVGGRLVVDGQKSFAATLPLARDLTAKTLEAWVAMPTLKQAGGGVIGVQTLNGGTFDAIVFGEQKPMKWIAGSNGFVRTRAMNGPDETAKPGELIHLVVTYDGSGRITAYRSGRLYGEPYTVEAPHGKVSFSAKDSQVVFGMRHSGGGNAFLQGEIEEARLYDFALTAEQVLASYRGGIERISSVELRAVMTPADRSTHTEAESAITRLDSQLAQLRRTSLTYAVNPKPHPPTVILKRGDVEKPGDPVTAGSPAVVKGPPPFNAPEGASEAERRLAFAEWVVHAENPLTWRVIVNRVWQHHFGAGLARSPSDLGQNGERASHPELLDWLAIWFRDSGGSIKALHRLIVLSATYRQAATFDPKAAEKDVDNQLLWRFAPRRLEAESVRDAMLAVSGKLNREAGGPSFRPFRVETFNSAFYLPFDEDRPDFNRRSVYRMNVTSSRDPVLDVLDCPDPSVKTPRRSTTTTPLQALTMMNNPFTNRLAKSFADRVQREAGANPEAQIALSYRLALGRLPNEAEIRLAARTIKESGLHVVCWALMNANEFVYLK